MRHNYQIVLESLMNGHGVEFGGETYYLSEEYDLCVEMDHWSYDTNGIKHHKGSKLHGFDISLSSFMTMCEKIPKADIISIAANNALQDILKKDRHK